ncbi:hypothetical protein BC827DRAFT_1231402 [Russula dissimulans]|nr:hypothetical protein BC827DRAFT_1231402 [Russula dissimulans]
MSRDRKSDIENRSDSKNPLRGKPGDPDYEDDSGPLFSLYSKMAAEEDVKLAERWQKDADNILVFTGLFSAVVTALLVVTIPDVRSNPQDITNFYLQQISNASAKPSPPSPGNQPPPFSAPTLSVVVNLLSFLSLFISLSCAVLATVVQQWARRYVRYTQPSQRSPKIRARTRAMFSYSVDRLFIGCISSLLPCYLNLAIFFFMIGLLVFIYNINHVMFIFMILLFVWSIGVYGFFTFLPLFQRGSLLYTPISTLLISLATVFVCLFHTLFLHRFKFSGWGIFDRAVEGVDEDVVEFAKKYSRDIDIRVLGWSLRALTDDDEVEKFLRAIPDFFRDPSSQLVSLSDETKDKLKRTLRGFLDRKLSSNSVSEDVVHSCLMACLDASHAALGRDETLRILENIRKGKWPRLLHSVELGDSLISWGDDTDESYGPQIRSVVSAITALHTSDIPTSLPAHRTALPTPPSDGASRGAV